MDEKEINKIKDFLEWIVCIVIALIIAILFRHYIGTPTIVKQPSMKPTLLENQRLWLNRWGKTTKKLPNRGDIITFEAPTKILLTQEEKEKSVIARYEKEINNPISKFIYYILEINKTSYIKRAIGLPGDHIVIEDGKVFINNNEYEEKYLQPGMITDSGKGICIDLIVPENTVFAMGDNRAQSTDSRCFGCIPLEKIESTVWIRIWPLSKFGKIDK